jgi:outer membrane protein TolC
MVGPDYRQPQTQLPVNWSTTETGSPAAKMADISRWWTVFNDPVLTELMEKAQADNRDLYQAEARLREARSSSVSQGQFVADIVVNSIGPPKRQQRGGRWRHHQRAVQ